MRLISTLLFSWLFLGIAAQGAVTAVEASALGTLAQRHVWSMEPAQFKTFPGPRWERLGPTPDPTGSVAYTMAIHPLRENELIVGLRPHGLFRSLDHGKTWLPMPSPKTKENTGVNDKSMRFLHPTYDSLFVGYETTGVHLTIDQGKQWTTRTEGMGNKNIICFEVDPRDEKILFIGTDGGLQRSDDGGVTWELVSGGLPTGSTTITDVVRSRVHLDWIMVALLDAGVSKKNAESKPAGIYLSVDNGVTWEPKNKGIKTGLQASAFGNTISEMMLDLCSIPQAPNHWYAGSQYQGLLQSLDHGDTWNAIAVSDLPPGQIASIDCNPKRIGDIAVTGSDNLVHRSLDGGKTWAVLANGLRLGDEGGETQDIEFVDPTGKKMMLKGKSMTTTNVSHFLCYSPDGSRLYLVARSGLYVLNLSEIKHVNLTTGSTL